MLPRPSERAFSLVEFVIATGVLVFGLAAIYNQFIELRIPSQQRLLMAQARAIGHQRLEELRAAPFDALKDHQGSENFARLETQPRFSIREIVSQDPTGNLEVAIQVGWDPTDDTEQTFPDGKLIIVRGLRAP